MNSKELFQQVEKAARRLDGQAHLTPVHQSRMLNELCGHPVFLKCENFQRVGAFKFRGAFNALSKLNESERRKGVLSFSSGNHAQALALAGKLLSISVTVVMPNDAPAGKLAATRGFGASVVLYDPASEDREQVAMALPDAAAKILIPPFDHYDVIAGQGTAALEFHRQLKDSGQSPLNQLLVPVGGGGLISGSAIASHYLSAGTRIIGVEPASADDAAQSLRSGRIVQIPVPDTIADGTRTRAVGQRTFAVMQELVEDIVTVTEEQIKAAVRFLFTHMKLVVEPSGALGVAALLAKAAPSAKSSGVILSGGNVDNKVFCDILCDKEDQ